MEFFQDTRFDLDIKSLAKQIAIQKFKIFDSLTCKTARFKIHW